MSMEVQEAEAAAAPEEEEEEAVPAVAEAVALELCRRCSAHHPSPSHRCSVECIDRTVQSTAHGRNILTLKSPSSMDWNGRRC